MAGRSLKIKCSKGFINWIRVGIKKLNEGRSLKIEWGEGFRIRLGGRLKVKWGEGFKN